MDDLIWLGTDLRSALLGYRIPPDEALRQVFQFGQERRAVRVNAHVRFRREPNSAKPWQQCCSVIAAAVKQVNVGN